MPRIVVFGDSITHGACDAEKGGWVERLKVYLANNYEEASVYNLGVSGDNTEDLIKRFEDECEVREPAIIIFAIGINDSQYIQTKDNPRVSIKKFEKNLNLLINQSKKFTNKIIFIGLTDIDKTKTMPIPWATTKYYDEENVNKYNLITEKVCKQNKLIFIPMQDVLDIKKELADGLHPNERGHEKIFKKVLSVIEKKL